MTEKLKTQIKIDPGLHRALRLYTAEHGGTMMEIANEGILWALQNRGFAVSSPKTERAA